MLQQGQFIYFSFVVKFCLTPRNKTSTIYVKPRQQFDAIEWEDRTSLSHDTGIKLPYQRFIGERQIGPVAINWPGQ